MNRPSSTFAIFAAIGTVLLSACTTPPTDGPLTSVPQKVSFRKHIKPIFEERCVVCHNGRTAAGDLNLRTRTLAFRRSPNGPFFVPGQPERSKVFRVIGLDNHESGAMPPTGHALSEVELETIKEWIRLGAEWPTDGSGTLEPVSSMH